ncbi:MAG: N-acetylmuramoyl-L-alanine amidase [Vicinamibacterales bacterium]
MTGRWLQLVLTAACCWQAVASGQVSRSDDALFADAMAKEKAVRTALGGSLGAEAVLKAVRTVVEDYDSFVRDYPDSSQSDDALWNAATLSLDAFRKYGDPYDQQTALGFMRRLAADYPGGALARKASDALSTASSATQVRTTEPARRTAPAPAAAAGRPKLATISDIERTVLADTIRITITLDAEVAYREERLSNPERFYVDLSGVLLGPRLADGTIRFDGDNHPVRQIRVGRHPNNVVRVVLEAAGIATCESYPMYAPYRLVLECVPEGVKRTVQVHSHELSQRVAAPPSVTVPVAARHVERHSPAVTGLPGSVTTPVISLPPPLLATQAIKSNWGLIRPKRVVGMSKLADVAAAAAAQTAASEVAAMTPTQNLEGGFSIARQLGLTVSRIVIDPGHGGQDPGARASGTTEAEISLDIALRLERLFQQEPNAEVILTRRRDVFVPLEERTAIANREGADLFLSIHVNGSRNRKAGGVETYFLNFASNQDEAEVAARENAVSAQSMGALQDVVKAITLNNKLDESRDFATLVQSELVTTLRPANEAVKDLGVKQAPFMVLIGAAMPSVLAEVSFLTNAQEARLLKSTAYRQRIAEALFAAIRKYQTSLKSIDAVALQDTAR